MKLRALAAIGLGLGFSACAVHAVQDCELNGQNVNPANGSTTQGKTGMMRCKDRDSGVLQREQELQDGKFMGLVRFYQNGKLLKEHSVNERGNQHGRSREFGPNGQVLRETSYDNGSAIGLARSFHPNGQLRRAAFHAQPGGEQAYAEFTERGQLRELRCGEKPLLVPAADDAKWCGFGGNSQIEFFGNDGTVRARATFAQGKRLRHEMLFDNGKPSHQEELAGSQRIERNFWPEGGKRSEVLWALVERGALKEREQEFAQNGTLVRERRWANGEPQSDHAFYLNGQPRSKAEYSGQGAARALKISEFHDNGVLAREGRFALAGRQSQTPVGSHKRYDTKGNAVAESIYDDKGRITRERSWDESSKLLRDDEVFEDGSRKAYAR
ncbi:MAG TPA: hypothetical protein VLJ57_10270 [Burkholderiaceae bacterium]|nr:hypothetical protein [Burkholderiaceae bacterium]